jgi:dihydrofolate reductase
VDENWGIGLDNQIPWHLSSDLKRFKKTTMGHHMIMGRKTYESIGKPLSGRITIILTRDKEFIPDVCDSPDCFVMSSVDDAISFINASGDDEVFIIGGGDIYEQCLHIADRIYLTQVHVSANVDTFFPKLNAGDWNISFSEYYTKSDNDQYPYTYKLLEKIK